MCMGRLARTDIVVKYTEKHRVDGWMKEIEAGHRGLAGGVGGDLAVKALKNKTKCSEITVCRDSDVITAEESDA